MEEAKLIRMAAAISEYTVSSMLRETVHSAAESINQAVLSVETLPWIPEHPRSELAKAQQGCTCIAEIFPCIAAARIRKLEVCSLIF